MNHHVVSIKLMKNPLFGHGVFVLERRQPRSDHVPNRVSSQLFRHPFRAIQ